MCKFPSQDQVGHGALAFRRAVRGRQLPAYCWTKAAMTYQVLGKWPETLWKQRKLSTELSDEYLFLTRDGILARKRNLEAVREHEEAAAERALIEANTARLRSQSCTSPGWPLSKRTAFGTLCWWLWVPHILGIQSGSSPSSRSRSN